VSSGASKFGIVEHWHENATISDRQDLSSVSARKSLPKLDPSARPAGELMKTLRTPDSRFEQIRALVYQPNYVDVAAGDGSLVRIHYFDEGPRSNDPVLMLHGEPSWAFTYRRVIAGCTGAGLRCVAPDLIGFGRSDKPVDGENHTYQRHVTWMMQFIDALKLQRITLLCHDWGGLIGLRLVAEHPDRFGRVIATNTTLPTGDRQAPEAFVAWQRLSQDDSDLAVGTLVQKGCITRLAPNVIAGYDAPFPNETYKAGIRRLPMLVPVRPDDPASAANRSAWQSLSMFKKPFLTVFGDRDPFTTGAEKSLQRRIPGAIGQPHVILPNVGHFIQEDAGEELARITVSFVRSEPRT
jgi:haloalkane dehalogenase